MLLRKIGSYIICSKLLPKQLLFLFLDRRAGKEFTNLEILSHIEYFIKILPNDQLSIVSDVATQESKNTLNLLAKTFEVASKIANPETSFEDLKSLKEAKIPDVEVLLKDAKRTLEHER